MSTFASPSIQQTSVFARLPTELILDIFDYLDILSIFRFLDTCRYHRALLLPLPGIWRTVRFMPLSEYADLATPQPNPGPSLLTHGMIDVNNPSNVNANSTTVTNAAAFPQFSKSYHRKLRQSIDPKGSISRSSSESGTSSTSGSESESETSAPSSINADKDAAHRLKHTENDRDKDRGGSRSLISEVYAVLRRFRKENGLVDFVREINMDATDSPQFPSPLVMLVKFPHLEILSARYRRKQTSLATDTHTLKDMLRNGDFMPHSLKLRRWNVFHPYMTKEDVTGFKQILDAIAIVSTQARDEDSTNNDSALTEQTSGRISGVQLDIGLCPGPLPLKEVTSAMNTSAVVPQPNTTHVNVGLHWAVPSTSNITASTTTIPSTITESSQSCSNIVWELERCRMCDAPQDRCWHCVWKCVTCGEERAPPYINHQTALERQRRRQVSVAATGTIVTNGTTERPLMIEAPTRPLTPPGSISLSQLTNPLLEVRSAYLPRVHASLPLKTLTRPPEFSFFD
ncbi:hypothetical protein BX616_002008 [Lobosporangium transversale]|nr:hypothetical protein BX616_002008 [Lobosporangium transversale]